MRRKRESGQVLITGVVMMVVLLLVILYAFDVHNVIRAKIKVDIAQQSAAMTGASWQKESLNLMGEINLLKASALLMEGSDNWKTPLPDPKVDEAAWKREMQSRVDLLTEMQTRVSFVGPLIGFAAAQQAAKNNGLNRVNDALGRYLVKFENEAPRYPDLINNYAWKEPYKQLVSRINSSGIAVLPNARTDTTFMPETRPVQLANERFYTGIMNCVRAIAANDPPKSHYWTQLSSILRSMDDTDFNGKWWEISNRGNFPYESEIFTVGVEFGGKYEPESAWEMTKLKSELEIYAEEGALPAQMKWCIYDQWWMPEYYRTRYPEYEYNHYNYWYGGGVLRKELKPQYIYEGPAAYVEGYADVRSQVSVRPSVRPYGSSTWKRDARETVRSSKENAILIKKQQTTSRVGSRRDEMNWNNYRPGSIAKALGELKDEKSPIELDMILPVFTKVSVMPTFMPIPYGFQVLKVKDSKLDDFLRWLAYKNTLDPGPNSEGKPLPDGTAHFLEALQFLANGVKGRAQGKSEKVDPELNTHISGRALRYYGFNHKFNKGAFENEFKERLWEWYKVRNQRVFQQRVLDGPGYLQEPKLFSNAPKLKRVKVKETRPDGTVVEKNIYTITREEKGGVKHYTLDEATHKVPIPDAINGGTAYRVYVNIANNASLYYVIDSRGRIVLKGGPDPTIMYNRHFGGEGGKCNCQGECTCKSVWNPGSYDGTRGPVRL